MKKRFLAWLAVCVLTLAWTVPAGAEALPSVQLNGAETACLPKLSNGRSYLPIHEAAELLGAEWVPAGEQITLTRGEKTATLPVTRLGEEDCLPLRAAGTALGYQVGWDRESRTVLLVDLAPLTAESDKTWQLKETRAQAGLLTAGAETYVARLASTLDPSCPLTALPLTDAQAALSLMTRAAELLEQEGSGETVLGDVILKVEKGEAETLLTLTLPAGEMLPAERLGLGEERVKLILQTGAEEAWAQVTLGDWQAEARWAA